MVKRLFQGVVLFFAVYAFVFVPLGRKTALEHIRAIVGTPAAQDAADEVKGGVTRLVRRLKDEARESTEETDRWLDERARRAEEAPSPNPAPPRPKLRATMSADKPQ
jgi:hypothetical protein